MFFMIISVEFLNYMINNNNIVINSSQMKFI